MIDAVDYIFGLLHCHINDQMNMTYTVKFRASPQLDDLYNEISEKLPRINRYYKMSHANFLSFHDKLNIKAEYFPEFPEGSVYHNLNLKNYEFIRLDCVKDDGCVEFIFTVSHIIMDGIGVISLAHYLLQGFSVKKIISYIDYSQMKKDCRKYLKGNASSASEGRHISKFLSKIRGKKEEIPIISLRKGATGAKSMPGMVKTNLDLSVIRKIAKSHKLTRENYLILKLTQTIFKFSPGENANEACLLNLTKNVRLTPINFVDEAIGNYSARLFAKFNRAENDCSNWRNKKYEETISKPYFDEMVDEWHARQIINRVPRFILNRFIGKNFRRQGENEPSSKITASFAYIPQKASLLFPPDLLKKYGTELLDYQLFLRVIRNHCPCFVASPNASGKFSIGLTFNEAFMEKSRAEDLLKMYKDLLMEG